MPPGLLHQGMATRQASRLCLRFAQPRKQISSTARRRADDPATNLADQIYPAKTSRPGAATPIPSRSPDVPSDSTNPSLHATKEQVPDTSFSNRQSQPPTATDATRVSANNRGNTQQQRRPRSELSQLIERGFAKRPPSTQAPRPSSAQTKANTVRRASVEAQMSRVWTQGDIYAPRDLSPTEMTKARHARNNPSVRGRPLPFNSRRKGGRDVIDELGVKPLTEYKNMAMMSEYVSEMGRIRHSRETGLRAVNQRKMARAIRRAVGIGLMPSVHRHPELHQERVTLRGQGNFAQDYFR